MAELQSYIGTPPFRSAHRNPISQGAVSNTANVDTRLLSAYKQGVETVSTLDTDLWRCELLRRQLPEGEFSYTAGSNQADLEPTCLALLTGLDHGARLARGKHFLAAIQNRDGSWPAFAGDQEASGLTGLAILTLNRLRGPEICVERSLECLLRLKGAESHWFCKWKFHLTDTQVQFDPAKFGWPWEPGTCSWVIPTAFSILALKQCPSRYHRGLRKERINCGTQMLYDRACPQGGWNAGNGVVQGMPMPPHIDATAIALLALRSEPGNEFLIRSVRWLETAVESCAAPWSLAWAIIALDAYEKPVGDFQQRLINIINPAELSDTASLAVALLALDCAKKTSALGVLA